MVGWILSLLTEGVILCFWTAKKALVALLEMTRVNGELVLLVVSDQLLYLKAHVDQTQETGTRTHSEILLRSRIRSLHIIVQYSNAYFYFRHVATIAADAENLWCVRGKCFLWTRCFLRLQFCCRVERQACIEYQYNHMLSYTYIFTFRNFVCNRLYAINASIVL